ncbi:MAG: hypothetical protein JSR29_08995 [Nitrospira sp.]|nr:hypothetical protein [Nitrospira sp.]
MQKNMTVMCDVDLKALVDTIEPPAWLAQLWVEHPEMMTALYLLVSAGILASVASFRVFVWLLTTGRIPNIERRLNEWDMRRMQKKDRVKKPTQTDKETRNDDPE